MLYSTLRSHFPLHYFCLSKFLKNYSCQFNEDHKVGKRIWVHVFKIECMLLVDSNQGYCKEELLTLLTSNIGVGDTMKQLSLSPKTFHFYFLSK